MLSVLFVDDDYLELEALKHAFDWDALGLPVVAAAQGGQEALSLCAAQMPDLLITDLRMPGMDGFELATRMRELNPNLHVIFISGYEDFSIAQNALQIKIDGYLLKPLNPIELLALVQKISGQEMTRRFEKSEQSRLMQLLQEAKPLLKERFWLDMLQSGNATDTASAMARAQALGIPMRDQQYVVVSCQFPRGASIDPIYAQSMLLRASKPLAPYEPVRVTALCYCVIAPFSDIVEDTMIVEKVEDFARQVVDGYKSRDVSPTMGASLPGRLKQIDQLFTQSQQALEASFQFGYGRLYWYEEKLFPKAGLTDIRPLMHRLDEALTGAETREIVGLVNTLFDQLTSSTQQEVQSVCIELISRAINLFSRFQISVQDVFGDGQNLWDKLLHMETIVDIRMWMQNVLTAFSMMRENQRRHVGQETVDILLKIIDAQYMEDLSITKFAEYVHFAPGYMCRLFKNRTGKSLMEALLERRMREAERLLSQPGSKVHQVAEQIGYASVSYFCKVFREYTGVTPGEYQK